MVIGKLIALVKFTFFCSEQVRQIAAWCQPHFIAFLQVTIITDFLLQGCCSHMFRASKCATCMCYLSVFLLCMYVWLLIEKTIPVVGGNIQAFTVYISSNNSSSSANSSSSGSLDDRSKFHYQ